MRWFVEISALGVKPGTTTTLCVEAPQWQPALQKARALRGDEGPLGNFSIELLEDGFRAIDPVSRLRYLVKRAPEDAALTTTAPVDGPAPSSKADAPSTKTSPAASKVEAPDPEIPPPPRARAMAKTIAFASQGAAIMAEAVKTAPAAPAAAPTPAPAAAPTPAPAAAVEARRRKPAQTIAYSSVGSAAVLEAAAKIETARAAPPVVAAPVAAPRPAPPPAAPALPSYTLLNEREDKPSERSPLSYREHVYAVAPGTSDDDAKRLILDRFESVRQGLEQARQGKLINLAIFDHVFQGRPERRPLVTLSWKDWKNEPPELQFPARDGVSVPPPPASAGPTPESSGPKAPSSVPAPVVPVSVAAAPRPVAVAEPVKVAPAAPVKAAPAAPVSEPVPEPKKTPAAVPAPVATKPAAAAPAAAPRPSPASGRSSSAPAPGSTKPSRAAAVSPSTPPRSAPQKRLSGEDLLTELFEAFNDLHFLRDSIEGAEFVLALTLEKLPSEVGLVSLFDMNKREFVVVRQTGGKERVVGQRQPEKAAIAGSAMRKRHAVVISKADEAKAVDDDRFRAIGVEIRSLICAPVELGGRYLGLIELLNPLDGGLFNEGDGNALTYIGQQFAEFAASRGVMIDPEQLKESVGAQKSTPASSKRS